MLRFDTLKFARELMDAGMDRRQAETLVRGLGDMDTSELATKSDLGVLKTDLGVLRTEITDLGSELQTEIASVRGEIASVRGEIAALRGELKSDIAGVKGEMFRFLYLQAMGIVGLTVALVKFLPG